VVPEHRDRQQDPVQGVPSARGEADRVADEPDRRHATRDGPPPLAEEVGDGEHDAGRQRQFGVEAGEEQLELRQDHPASTTTAKIPSR
jgi:hypothetical protein